MTDLLPMTDDERRREDHEYSCWQGCDDLHPDEDGLFDDDGHEWETER